MSNLNISNVNMEFKGNPIYGGNLSKKYIKFIEANPNASIPIRLLNKREYKKGVLKLLKKFSDRGFNIEDGKLTKIKSSNINELYKHANYDPDVGDYFPNGLGTEGKSINYDSFLYDKLEENKFQEGDMVRLIVTGNVKNKTLKVKKLIWDDEKGSITVNVNEPAEVFFKKFTDWNSNIENNIIINITIKVPKFDNKGKTDFNNERYLWYNSEYPNIIAFLLKNEIDTRLVVTKQIELTEANIFQKYAEGVNHCLLDPILKWAIDAEQNAKGVSKNKYQSIKVKLQGKKNKSGEKIGYIEKYKDGIPEDELQSLSDDLRVKITIERPLRTNNNIIEFIPDRKALKTFSFCNTRLNHVEHYTTTNYKDMVDDEMNQDEINIKFNELNYSGEYFIFGRTKYGISWIQTHDKIYKLDSPYTRASNKFMDECNFKHFAIDAITQPDLTKFVDNGTHFNATTDFTYIDQSLFTTNKNIKHIDIKKAYTQFKASKYYNGFCGSITDLRQVDNYDQVGLYYIDNIDFSKANSKFVFYNNYMNWFINKNIYTDAELRFLKDMKVSFIVKYGAYGIKTDFQFNDDMIKGKESIGLIKKPSRYNGDLDTFDEAKEIDLRISFYAKFIGKCYSAYPDKKISMFGESDYFRRMKDRTNKIFYDYDRKEATIFYPRKRVEHYKHITAQVLAYQRLNIMEQIMRMDETKILRVCVDGIYYEDHDFEMSNIYQDKTSEMTFMNSPSVDYLSNIFKDKDKCSVSGIKFGPKRTFIQKLCVIGGGGNGKSTREFMDHGHTNVLYLAPSWKLSAKVLEELANKERPIKLNDRIDVNVYHRFLYMDFEYNLQKRYNVILCDEASQLTEKQKQIIFNIPNKKVIFLGDIGYQLEPVIDYKELKKYHIKKKIQTDYLDWIKTDGHFEMNLKGFDKVEELTTDYRATCNKLKDMKKKLREMIIKQKYAKKDVKNEITQQALDYVRSNIQKGDPKELYKRTDMILSSTHEKIKYYNQMFSHLEKYLVKSNSRLYKNGQIVFEKPEGVKIMKYKDTDIDVNHCYTIHAIQGETLGHNDKLFIDFDNMFSGVRMIYTAISRARRLDQIYLI